MYPPELCEQILLGIQEQLNKEAKATGPYLGNLMKKALLVYDLSQPKNKLEVRPEDTDNTLEDWETGGDMGPEYCAEDEGGDDGHHHHPKTTFDSVTGDILPAKLVEKAREEEIAFMR